MTIIGDDPLPEDVSSLLALATDDGATIAHLADVAATLGVAELNEVVRRMRRSQAAKERLAFVPTAALRSALALRNQQLEPRR